VTKAAGFNVGRLALGHGRGGRRLRRRCRDGARRRRSYPNVIDIPLCPYELVVCCSPSYLCGKSEPRNPTELVDHECLTTTLFRTSWMFESARGAQSVEVHSRLHSSDGRVMREAARHGLGIAALARYLAVDDFRSGKLVPRMKMNRPVVREFVAFLKTRLQDASWAEPQEAASPVMRS
jgi:DNA-binding transcriptional LysR family regulator